MRTISRVVIILILIGIVVGIMVGGTLLDGIVKKGMETYGPQISKVSVNLESVHVILFNGSVKIKGLVIGNPKGYKAPEAVRANFIECGVNPFTILSDKIVVRTIQVVSPEITFEGGLGGNNLGKIADNINASSKTPPSTNVIVGPATSAGKKFQVDDFLITGARVNVRLTDLGGKEMSLSLPEIHLTNLGTGSGGITPADLTEAMLKAITAATLKTISMSANGFGTGAENLRKEAADGADKIKKSIGGLLGK